MECRCRAGCGDQPLPIPGALDFWSGVQAILLPSCSLRPSSLPVDTDTDSSLQEGKVRDRMVFWVEVGAARPTTVIHDDGADSQH